MVFVEIDAKQQPFDCIRAFTSSLKASGPGVIKN